MQSILNKNVVLTPPIRNRGRRSHVGKTAGCPRRGTAFRPDTGECRGLFPPIARNRFTAESPSLLKAQTSTGLVRALSACGICPHVRNEIIERPCPPTQRVVSPIIHARRRPPTVRGRTFVVRFVLPPPPTRPAGRRRPNRIGSPPKCDVSVSSARVSARRFL